MASLDQYQEGKINLQFQSTEEIISAITFGVIGLLGIIFQSLIIASSISKKNKNPSLILYFTICFSDLIYLSVALFVSSINVANGGWSIGVEASVALGILIRVSYSTSILMIASITMEYYFAIFYLRRYTMSDVWIIVVTVCSINTAFSLIPYLSGTYLDTMSIQSSKLISEISWYSSQPVSLFMVVVTVLLFTVSISAICLVYLKVIRLYLTLIVQKRRINQPITSRERIRLLVKAASIGGSITVSWMPYIVNIVIQAHTGTQTSRQYDAFCTIFSLLNAVSNPILFYLYNPTIKYNVNHMLGYFPQTGSLGLATEVNIPTQVAPLKMYTLNVTKVDINLDCTKLDEDIAGMNTIIGFV